MTNEQIENIFTYHSPNGDQVSRYIVLRSAAKVLAWAIQDKCPESREKSLAFTNLQQTVMWANAAIALNPVRPKLQFDETYALNALKASDETTK